MQKAVWGWEDLDLLPLRLFVVARKIEGQVIGAFEPSGKMIGFCLAVPALHGSTVYLHSHMLAVLSEYREQGIGQRLKWEQRRNALSRGIGLIEWTFDPLEVKNAYFNLERLGAVARRYVENQYGISSSPLHRGLPTDRLVAEWWLESPRVAALSKRESVERGEIRQRIAVPLDVAQGSAPGKSLAEFQLALRRQFQEAFAKGLAVVGFEISEKTGTYVLGSWMPQRQGNPKDREEI
ncbi:MAG: GNAT family N-acetyltransferase [Acidobacteria bacterium]|nr:GNAT family N-acetyltransferase [Acidobacteriota bacterium]